MEIDPIKLFHEWYEEAEGAGLKDPSAMALATADKAGIPSVRMVLLKNYDEHGFCFYTNYNSRKGRELAENPHAALCFYWEPLKKQVRIEGKVEKVTPKEADLYFNSRHPESRVGAVASEQSAVLESREVLFRKVAEVKAQYGENPARPGHWSGFRVIPEKIEFWEEGQHRLHNRILCERAGEAWKKTLLYP